MDFNLVSYEKYLKLVSRCLFIYFLMVSRCMIFNCLFTKRVRSILLFLYFAYYFCLINNKNFYILIIFKLVSWFTYIDIFLYWYHVGRIYFIAYLDPFVDDLKKKRGEVFDKFIYTFDEFIYACLFHFLILYKKGEKDFESLCIYVLFMKNGEKNFWTLCMFITLFMHICFVLNWISICLLLCMS